MAPPRSPPLLIDDVFSEILLRLPPDDPACLVRASTVCKLWLRTLADPPFSRRYRAFHRTPPVLGFLCNLTGLARFHPTTSFRPSALDHNNCWTLDCRHGRVLYYSARDLIVWDLIVWDPITGDKHRLPRVPGIPQSRCNAAVLCAAGGGCDHRACHEGPFLVAFVGTEDDGSGHACLYSSETGSWSVPTSIDGLGYYVEMLPATLVGDALYFICQSGIVILRYDLRGRGLSVIERPGTYGGGISLMPAEDGRLGFAGMDGFHFYWWSRESGPDDDAGWAQPRVMDLEKLLPAGDPYSPPYLLGFADGPNVIFVSTLDGIFTIELKSLQTRKVWDRIDHLYRVFPYMSFYTPADLPQTDTTDAVIHAADRLQEVETQVAHASG